MGMLVWLCERTPTFESTKYRTSNLNEDLVLYRPQYVWN